MHQTMSTINNSFTVPTVFEKQEVKMDITGLSASDLEQLKKRDGFMYHSIQAALKAREADAASGAGVAIKVTRKTVISHEHHPDVLLQAFVEMLESGRQV
jgi:hypothetical protein